MRCLFAALLLTTFPALAQKPAPLAIDSHHVHPDGSITFRYQNAGAASVVLETDASLQPLPMQRDSSGLWSVTTPPLPAERYSYSFIVNGVQQLDPLNADTTPNLIFRSSRVLVPGHPPAPWELTQIPHGNVTEHMLTTYIARGLPMNQEPYTVYTPPNFDPHRKGGYPVLYLLHGWSDFGDAWITIGRANLILDSLIATGSIVPMIVVMPQGYGNYSFVTSGQEVWNAPAKIDENLTLYSRMLMREIIPAVDREYPIAKGRDNHAIAGLSMGGLESLTIGLNQAGYFAYVGGFSSAIQHTDLNKTIMDPGQARDLRLLWVACGTSDGLLTANRNFVTWARTKKLPITPIETAGKHTWLVWRDNLIHFAPLLFRNQK